MALMRLLILLLSLTSIISFVRMIPRSVMIKSKKLLCQSAVDSSEVEASSSPSSVPIPSSNGDIDSNDTIVNSNTIENNKTTMKKKKLSVRNEIQLRGSNANVYWRSVSMQDLRLHPLYIPLPPSNTINITSVESLSLFRQDSLEWSLLHKGRLTTSKAAACLGLYESTAAKLLNVPRSLTSHHRVLSSFRELQDDPIDLNELKALSVESLRINEQTPRNKTSQRTWRANTNNNNTNNSFPFSYHPDIRFVKTVRGISSASSARMSWGTAQEATSILAVINYFASTNTSVKIKEVGLLPLEQVSETAKDDDTYGLGFENSQRIKAWVEEGSLPLLGASPDGIIDFDDGHCEILECKNSSPFIQMNSYKQSSLTINQKSLFKGLGSWFIPQLMLEILCAGPTCTGAVLIQLSAISGAQIYRVERNNDYIALMLEWLKTFYVTYVTQNKEPEEDFHINNDKYLEFLKATKRISDNCKVVCVIPQDSIQRSSLNTKYFL